MARLRFEHNKDAEEYWVFNKKSEQLGFIYYYRKWKKWVWEQDKFIIMSKGCMREVADFMETLK